MDQPVVIQQPDRPQMTVEVPAGWGARENKRQLILTRDGRRVVVRQCRLDRAERDMTGKRAAREVRNGLPVRGGGCLIAKGAPKLRAQLGKGSLPASDRDAERIAREARTETLAAPRRGHDARDRPQRAAQRGLGLGSARALLPDRRGATRAQLRSRPRRRRRPRPPTASAHAGAARRRRSRTTRWTPGWSCRNSTRRRAAAPRGGSPTRRRAGCPTGRRCCAGTRSCTTARRSSGRTGCCAACASATTAWPRPARPGARWTSVSPASPPPCSRSARNGRC